MSALVEELTPYLVQTRRTLHRHPELGWCEFRTTALVAAELQRLGYRVRLGRAAVSPEHRLGVPTAAELAAAAADAAAGGVAAEVLAAMTGGLTGVIADLDSGRPGPTLAFRVDIDALPIAEATDPDHRPAAAGFASTVPGRMHACGHDGHTAIGLGLAHTLRELLPVLCGRVRLIFQPGEEGGRAALAMVAAGACQGVDDLICIHLGLDVPWGTVVAGSVGFLATSKLVATFRGRASHAGFRPEEGRSAILAAAHATLGIHGLSQHSGGVTRANVGVIRGGVASNIVAGDCVLELETRSDRQEIQDELEARARRVLAAAADLTGCRVNIAVDGRAVAEDSHPGLAAEVAAVARDLPGVEKVEPSRAFGASEDATDLMRAVHAGGGRAVYTILGTTLAAGHHNERFDFDERVLPLGVSLLTEVARRRLGYAGA